MVATIRGLTRPIVTLLLVGALIILTVLWTLGIAVNEIPEMFSGLVGVVIGYWFAERTSGKQTERPPTS